MYKFIDMLFLIGKIYGSDSLLIEKLQGVLIMVNSVVFNPFQNL